MGKYTTIQLPTEFVEEFIDEIILERKYGYTSRAEVVKAAVRQIHQQLFSPSEN